MGAAFWTPSDYFNDSKQLSYCLIKMVFQKPAPLPVLLGSGCPPLHQKVSGQSVFRIDKLDKRGKMARCEEMTDIGMGQRTVLDYLQNDKGCSWSAVMSTSALRKSQVAYILFFHHHVAMLASTGCL